MLEPWQKLAVNSPNHGKAEKEPAMNNKTIWYGTKDNDVRFSHDENALKSQGFNNPRSFTVSGDVNGLNLIGEDSQSVASSSQQTA